MFPRAVSSPVSFSSWLGSLGGHQSWLIPYAPPSPDTIHPFALAGATGGPSWSGTQLCLWCPDAVGLHPVGESHLTAGREEEGKPGGDLVCTDASQKRFNSGEDVQTGICILKRARLD